MSLRYQNTQESGNFSEWDLTVLSGNLTVTAPGLNGSSYKISAPVVSNASSDRVEMEHGSLSTLGNEWHYGYRLEISSISYGTATQLTFAQFNDAGGGGVLFILYLIPSGGNHKIRATFYDKTTNTTLDSTATISSGSEFTLEIVIERSTDDSTADGNYYVYIDGVEDSSWENRINAVLFDDEKNGDHEIFNPNQSSSSGWSGSLFIDDVTFRDDATFIFPPASTDSGTYVIGTAIDNETDGETAFITLWRDNNMYLQRWDLPTLTKEDEITLGAASLTAVQNRSKVAYPYAGSASKLWVFGNMDTPVYLTGTVHLIQSTNGGASGSWTITPDLSSWAAGDVLDSLFVTPDLDGIGTRQFSAIRRQTSSAPELWQGLNALSLVSALPFPSGSSVEYRGMHIGQNREIAVGTASIGTGTNRIVSAADPYTSWTDITNNYPSGTVEVLRYL